MAEQLDIFAGRLAAPVAEKRAERPSIEERFADFNAANPHVLRELLRLARARLDAGATRIGMKALWEELRASLIATAQRREAAYDGFDGQQDKHTYKLNNDYTALYARALIAVEPALERVIEMRRRKS